MTCTIVADSEGGSVLVDLVDPDGDIVISSAASGELESLIQGYTATTTGTTRFTSTATQALSTTC